MATREVDHVDIVAYSRAVARRIVTTKYSHLVANTYGDLSDVGHQVVRNPLWVLADQAARVCANGVEVPEQSDSPRSRAGSGDIPQDVLHHAFRLTVRIGRAERRIFADRHRRSVAVDGG